MLTKTQLAAQVAVCFMFSYSRARIVRDSPLWTGKDWYDEAAKIGVENGIPYSNDEAVERFIEAPVALEGDVPDYEDFANVQRVMRLFPADQFEFMFPLRKPLYTYEGFLKAVGKYPAFCDDKGPHLSAYTDDQACQRELAVMFAHFNQETGAHDPHSQYPFWRQQLAHITEWACTEPQWGAGQPACNYAQTWDSWARTAYPPQSGVQYYGRGPFQLSWNYNYGAFSKVLVESTFNSHMYLLQKPDQVHTDSFTVFLSALWFYMTPQAPKPSIHDVASGNFVPTAVDEAASIYNGFGVTTNIINGGQECGSGWENAKSQYRIDTYVKMLEYFDLPAEAPETMTCGNQASAFPSSGGYGNAYSYFHYYSGDKCTIVNTQTPYHISTLDDYKRCVCNALGSGEADCPQDDDPQSETETESDTEPEPESETDSDPETDTDPVSVSDPAEEFEDIWEKPHHDPDEPSRTMYQVDRSLDYIEQKLAEMHAIFKAKGMIA